ncbi:MAG: tRNA guanosine(34) transglycosylase Tgt [Rickettsiales bacterium]|nr:tRNA guanosine(34) transglycosylase Tgt [Rickettsiales bacterium]
MKEEFLDEEKNGLARRSVLHTAHGDINTPVFMPVGTVAAMKAMHFDQLKRCGADIMLCNTYHLMIQDRYEIIEKMGGLHQFMNWNKPILTDCGGFQAMSLGKLNKIKEEGVNFSCHLSGKKYNLTPEFSMEIQYKLGTTITMALDECVRQPSDYEYTKKAMLRSLRWAERSKKAFVERNGYALFGIVQGGADKELRTKSVDGLRSIDFDGYAIGGDLSINDGWELMFDVLDYLTPLIPFDKPRYLMGVGKPIDIVGSVLRGVDMFDCVLPARNGRNGQAFTRNGVVNIRNSQNKYDTRPLDEKCECVACRQHSRAYLHHLFRAREMLGAMLLTEHNIMYYQDLMREIRAAIEEKRYKRFVEEFMK